MHTGHGQAPGPRVPATSLDPLETNPDPDGSEAQPLCVPIPPDAVSFRHSGWQPLRRRVRAALSCCGAPRSRLEAFDNCGDRAWVLRSVDDPDLYTVAGDLCHDRFCVPCANQRSRTIAANVRALVQAGQARFRTLTFRAQLADLASTLRKAVSSFSRLRARKLWKTTQAGGCAFIEVKRNRTFDTWNVHLHIIAQGRYIDQAQLSRAWQQITETSFVVDVRFIKNADNVTRYVTKYASKPMDPTVTEHDEHLREAIKALSGRRLCTTFGTWRTNKLTITPEGENWEAVCPFDTLVHRIAIGDPEAISIWQAIQRQKERQPSPTRQSNARPPPSEQQLQFAYAGSQTVQYAEHRYGAAS